MLLKPHKPASAQKKEDREKRKYEYAICRIRRKGCQARDETLGSGFFVRNLIIPGFAFHFCLVASEKYIPGDDFETYYLEFKQFESTELERIELNEIASSDRSDVYRTLDLICIRINVDRIKKKTFYKDSSRSFKVVTERLGSYENLFCYFVDDSQAKSLVKQVRIELNSRKGFQILDGVDTYSTYNQFTQGKLDGGVILKRIEGELQVVGVLQFTNEGTISPVFFPLPSEGKGKMPLSQCATEIENGRAASGSEMVEEEGQDSGIDLTLGNQHSSESNQDGGGASENDLVIEGQRDLERSLTVGNQHSLQSSQVSTGSNQFNPKCLPSVEATDMVSYQVLETSYYTTQQFKCHKNLEAYNQMVRGSVTTVQDKIIARKHVVVGKGGHTQSESKCLVCIRHFV